MVQSDIIVRRATLDDLKRVEEACQVINQAYRTKGGWTTEDFVNGQRLMEQDMIPFIEKNGTPYTLLFAMDSDQIVGTIQIQPLSNGTEAEVGLFSVSPTQQSRGIGGKLVQAALLEMKEMKFTNAVMRVLENRPEILAWYKKLGFLETGERVPFIWPEKLQIPGLQFLVLKKSLQDL
ncbi:unnamed protein product [Rhizopus stolonifer]